MQLKILLMWFLWINYCKVSPILTIQMFWQYKVSLPLSLMLMAILPEVAGVMSRVEDNNGILTGYQFNPSSDFNGSVILKYTVVDGNGPGIDGSLNLFIEAINDAPTLPTYGLNKDAAEGGELITGQLTASDIEIGTGEVLPTSLTFDLVGEPIPGLVINADGSLPLILPMLLTSIYPWGKS